MTDVYKFMVRDGLAKPSFHIIDRLSWFLLDKEKKISISSSEAIATGRVKILNKNDMFTDFWCKEPFIMVSVAQNGHRIPSYISRYIVRLGGNSVIRIDTFKKPGPLFFEADGELLEAGEIIKNGLEFACESKRTAPRVISMSVVSTRERGYAPTEGRGIHIVKPA
jgi:hypothetical protein